MAEQKKGAPSILPFLSPRPTAISQQLFNAWLLRLFLGLHLPFNLVSSPLVIAFFRAICGLAPPHRTTLSRQVPAVHAELVSIVKQRLAAATSAAIQYDFWTHSVATVSYGSVNVAIPCTTFSPAGVPDTTVEFLCLGATEMKGSHTAENLRTWVLSVLQQFSLSINPPLPGSPVIFAGTIDNAANGRLSTSLLGILNIPCIAHTLNLVLQSSLAKIEPIISFIARLKSLTKLFNKSAKAAELLRVAVENHKEDVLSALRKEKPGRDPKKVLPDRLIKPVPTRWSSYISAFIRVSALWKPLLSLFESPAFCDIWQKNRSGQPLPLTPNDEYLLSGILPPLHSFNRVLAAVQGRSVTLGEAYHYVAQLYTAYKTPPHFSLNFAGGIQKQLVATLAEQLKHYFFSSHSYYALHQNTPPQLMAPSQTEIVVCRASHLVALSARLDPRLIGSHCSALLSLLHDADMLGPPWPNVKALGGQLRSDIFVKYLLQNLVTHHSARQEHAAPPPPTQPEFTEEVIDTANVFPFAIQLLGEGLPHRPPAASPGPPPSDPLMEVHEFWRASIPAPFPMPLNYWHQQARFWPHLAAVAQQIFVLSATSAETERVFSLAGSIGDDLRSRLTEDKFDSLVFCARNMHLLPAPAK